MIIMMVMRMLLTVMMMVVIMVVVISDDDNDRSRVWASCANTNLFCKENPQRSAILYYCAYRFLTRLPFE